LAPLSGYQAEAGPARWKNPAADLPSVKAFDGGKDLVALIGQGTQQRVMLIGAS
jgi:hypothetical protein